MRTLFLAVAAAALASVLSVSASFAAMPSAAATGIHASVKAADDVDAAACVRRRVCERGRCAYRRVCR